MTIEDTVDDGLVETAVAGSVITLAGADVNATASVAAGSTIATKGGSTGNSIGLALGSTSVENAGTIAVTDNSALTLNNTVANTGTIAVNAASHDATLEINNTTLTGHGTVKLTNNVGNMITSDQAAGSVTDATLSVGINGTVHVGDEVQVSFTVQGENSTVIAGLTDFYRRHNHCIRRDPTRRGNQRATFRS